MQEFCKRRWHFGSIIGSFAVLGIFSNNLDEFFRVRFAAIRRLSLTGITGENIGGISAQQLVKDITEIVIEQQSESLRILNIIESEATKKIFSSSPKQIFIEQEFSWKIFLFKSESWVGDYHFEWFGWISVLKDTSGYLAIKLVMKKGRWSTLCSHWNSKNHQPLCGLAISRWKANIILLDDVIRQFFK
jgi:polyphosphate kinase